MKLTPKILIEVSPFVFDVKTFRRQTYCVLIYWAVFPELPEILSFETKLI